MYISRASHVALLAALCTLGTLSLAACGTEGKTSTASAATSAVTSSDGTVTVPKGQRQFPREIRGETIEGKNFNVADLKAKVVVINVWGSWCPPCRAEAPHFSKVAQETESKGVAFVGIDTREANRGQALAFQKDFGIKYSSLYDPTGKVILNGFPKGSLNPQAIPSTIILDRHGRIAARALRELTEESLRKMLKPLILEK
ncbi:TlpA family protein disulfide reductase [Streptomyces sp. 8L]|uniref:TlpA family protein disulfide reductase n=1 Tax=Streptomyces sp. 8L TaxID=2877242 RepID=UPI001CD78112|nr:TlpA disulfide reductase family protein [Streptomyces sp. 8L]MCA1223858.1 TlpA family protein disulfide reductase [Streptomyces sp. 8L]